MQTHQKAQLQEPTLANLIMTFSFLQSFILQPLHSLLQLNLTSFRFLFPQHTHTQINNQKLHALLWAISLHVLTRVQLSTPGTARKAIAVIWLPSNLDGKLHVCYQSYWKQTELLVREVAGFPLYYGQKGISACFPWNRFLRLSSYFHMTPCEDETKKASASLWTQWEGASV